MSSWEPPSYPRVPHLIGGRGTADDLWLKGHEVREFLRRPVLVEEKLDGANVVLWQDAGVVRCSLRSGVNGMDRGRQLGPLRGWIAERHDQIVAALVDVAALYGEWLYFTHTVAYDCLDSYLVGLDVLTLDGTFASSDERNSVVNRAGLGLPPLLHCGPIGGGVSELDSMIGQSRLGSERMEGLVVRPLNEAQTRVAKLVRKGFTPVGTAAWRSGRPHNRLHS